MSKRQDSRSLQPRDEASLSGTEAASVRDLGVWGCVHSLKTDTHAHEHTHIKKINFNTNQTNTHTPPQPTSITFPFPLLSFWCSSNVLNYLNV